MNLMPKLVLLCLLVNGACCAHKFLPLGSGPNYGGLSKRQDHPSCNPCKLPPVAELKPAIDLLQGIGQIVTDAKVDIKNILRTTFNTTDDLRSAIDKNLQDIKEETDLIVSKISRALESVECPPLGTLILGFKVHMGRILDDLTKNWDEFATDVDLESVLAALAKSMALDVPDYFILLRDLMFECADVLLVIGDCELVADTLYTILDPNSKFSNDLAKKLSSPGNTSIALVKNILGSVLEDGGGGGGLDILHIFTELLCGALQVIHAGTDYSKMTGGICPNVPETDNFVDILQKIACDAADVLGRDALPQEIIELCYPD